MLDAEMVCCEKNWKGGPDRAVTYPAARACPTTQENKAKGKSKRGERLLVVEETPLACFESKAGGNQPAPETKKKNSSF